MRRLAIVLSLSILDACATHAGLRATHAALRGAEDLAPPAQACLDQLPCGGGDGSVVGSVLAYGIGAAALGIGVGALISKIVRSAPPPAPAPPPRS